MSRSRELRFTEDALAASSHSDADRETVAHTCRHRADARWPHSTLGNGNRSSAAFRTDHLACGSLVMIQNDRLGLSGAKRRRPAVDEAGSICRHRLPWHICPDVG
jgi:hypothetical protein